MSSYLHYVYVHLFMYALIKNGAAVFRLHRIVIRPALASENVVLDLADAYVFIDLIAVDYHCGGGPHYTEAAG